MASCTNAQSLPDVYVRLSIQPDQPARVYPEEVVPFTVDENHRDQLCVLVGEGWVVIDGDDLVPHPSLPAHLSDHGLGLIAQVQPARPMICTRTARASSLDPAYSSCPVSCRQRRCLTCRCGNSRRPHVLPSCRQDGIRCRRTHDVSHTAAFFDVDNTISGSSLFHLAVGLAKRKYFNAREISGFASKLKFVLSGSEDLEDMASATEAALSFVQNRSVQELQDLAEQIFDAEMVDKLIPGSLALAQGHLDAGQQVWLVTATPQELATVIARRLGLTGALGTIAESRNGIYTGKLHGPPLHGLAKAEAVRALSTSEGLISASAVRIPTL